jgi:hypothetical protein
MDWSRLARETIAQVHAGLPSGASLSDRKKAVDAAYPFGPREYWPYKAWLKARKAYLVQYGYGPPLPIEVHLSPLERMQKASGA